MDASFTGKPIAVKTKRVVTAPVAGIPAAPMLETAAVTLQSEYTFAQVNDQGETASCSF